MHRGNFCTIAPAFKNQGRTSQCHTSRCHPYLKQIISYMHQLLEETRSHFIIFQTKFDCDHCVIERMQQPGILSLENCIWAHAAHTKNGTMSYKEGMKLVNCASRLWSWWPILLAQKQSVLYDIGCRSCAMIICTIHIHLPEPFPARLYNMLFSTARYEGTFYLF